ncbi:PIR Superfamily Protein [Plasmodium ovale wallikeri]|uniref:PIR Superfamily Protein n=2 Tax=Plasmodium ovale TaxID=36330 RepID=A0A1A9AGT8_PLAOA|nr:PIR Superfamily Protein [Plasmodium ovale wallikeri]SBT55318.1 PIR Superfamily Protein [Plasmodium ovale wallikeri]SBT73143.1 PIR protein [Plasmodium ovale]
MGLLKDNEWDGKLQHLPSYKKYAEFNNEENIPDDKGVCNDIGTSDEGTKTFCKQVARSLRELSRMNKGKDRSEQCFYFQHWFYDEIRKRYSNNGKNVSNMVVAKKLFHVLNKINLSDLKGVRCECYMDDKLEEWKKEKDLHDYFKNHGSINCNDSDKDKCLMHREYVTYIKQLYQDKHYDCCGWGLLEDECKHYFKCENDYEPSNLLTNLEGELVRINGEQSGINRNTVTGEILNFGDSQGRSVSSQGNIEGTSFDGVSIHELSQDVDDHFTILTTNSSMLKYYIRTGLLTASVLGTIIFFFLYVRFSSSGWSSKRRVPTEKKYNNYFHEMNTNEMSPDELESAYTYSPRNQLYMPYHSSENSEITARTIRNDLGQGYYEV